MDLAADLAVFTLVAEEGSFSAAGRPLNLAPSSIARVLDRIEARFGVRLLLRTTRSLTLTPEGATYAPGENAANDLGKNEPVSRK